MNYPYCPHRDRFIRTAIYLNMFSEDDRGSKFVLLVGDTRVWVGNYPYAYGTDNWTLDPVRPSVGTIKLLRQVQNKIYKDNKSC